MELCEQAVLSCPHEGSPNNLFITAIHPGPALVLSVAVAFVIGQTVLLLAALDVIDQALDDISRTEDERRI